MISLKAILLTMPATSFVAWIGASFILGMIVEAAACAIS